MTGAKLIKEAVHRPSGETLLTISCDGMTYIVAVNYDANAQHLLFRADCVGPIIGSPYRLAVDLSPDPPHRPYHQHLQGFVQNKAVADVVKQWIIDH